MILEHGAMPASESHVPRIFITVEVATTDTRRGDVQVLHDNLANMLENFYADGTHIHLITSVEEGDIFDD